jgi:hypothetical protein
MKSSLARFIPRSNADEEQLFAMRRDAWVKHGFICVRPGDVTNEFDRQAIVNVANRLYGKRQPEQPGA